MFYTNDYLCNLLKNKLNDLNIFIENEKDKTHYIFDYNGHRAKINLDNFLVRLDNEKSDKSDRLVDNFVFQLTENLIAQNNFSINDFSKEKILENVYPVLRSVSFAKDNKEKFVTQKHTNETKIFYSLDLGSSYRLLTTNLLKEFNISNDEIYSNAIINLEKLPLNYNVDTVANNNFYFLNSKDGYDGSRLLNENVLKYFYNKIGSDFYVGIPHQDTLIIADIKNKKGLEILQKMMVHFFTEGRIPITTITFKYDNKKLESLFIFVE